MYTTHCKPRDIIRSIRIVKEMIANPYSIEDRKRILYEPLQESDKDVYLRVVDKERKCSLFILKQMYGDPKTDMRKRFIEELHELEQSL